ncbi:MAG: helix-turn-helix domain-containing protein [Lachnospiraceae bacterium]|nr:helix-turn-helix domain-containing protein [Lachnospiraceae bacterium]
MFFEGPSEKIHSERKGEVMRDVDTTQIRILRSISERSRFVNDAVLFYVLEGSLSVVVNGKASNLGKEDVMVVNLHRSYEARASEDALFVRVILPTPLISRMNNGFSAVFLCDSSREEDSNYGELRGILKQLLKRYLSLQMKREDFGYIAQFYRLMDVLFTHFTSNLFPDSGEEAEPDEAHRREKIDAYIYSNYNQPLSSKELADKLYLSQGYLTRYFKKYYGMSFTDYVNNVRLEHANDDLRNSDLSITHIAYNNGFASVAAFTKAFREAFGENPSVIRKKMQTTSVSHGVVDEEAENKLQTLLQKDWADREETAGRRISERIRADQWTDLTNTLCDTINVGRAADLLDSQVRQALEELGNSVPISHVRFWNLFSREMLIGRDSKGEYNFSRIDSVFDFLLEHNIKPHLELGQKPRKILSSVGHVVNEWASDDLMKDRDAGKELLDALIRHWKLRYSHKERSGWRFELWIDEEHWGKPETDSLYFQQFGCIFEAIKKVFPDAEIGGCGFRIGLSDVDAFVLPFLEKWRREKVTPDFISILFFPYERGEKEQDTFSRRMTDNEAMLHKVKAFRNNLTEAGFENIKLYITEWNLTISQRNYMNDALFKGAYIVKSFLDTLHLVDGLFYFFATDLVSEFADASGLVNGSTGLISKDGIWKPAGAAYQFASWLYGHEVHKGKNFLVTTDGNGSYGILLHAQKPLNYLYYLEREEDVDREALRKYFDDQENTDIELIMEKVPEGTYKVKSYQVDERSGNIMNFWKELGFDTELTRHDIHYLKKICTPRLTISTQSTDRGKLILNAGLMPNEVRFIRIRKIK